MMKARFLELYQQKELLKYSKHMAMVQTVIHVTARMASRLMHQKVGRAQQVLKVRINQCLCSLELSWWMYGEEGDINGGFCKRLPSD